MSNTSKHTHGDVIQKFLSVADLLKDPHMARVYVYLAREGEATTHSIMNALNYPLGTTCTYLNTLEEAGVITPTTGGYLQTYAAVKIDFTITGIDDDQEYTITPAVIDAISRRTTVDNINRYIDSYGISGLITTLNYMMNRRIDKKGYEQMAHDLNLPSPEAERILQALHPIVHAYTDIEDTSTSLAEGADTETLHTDTDDM